MLFFVIIVAATLAASSWESVEASTHSTLPFPVKDDYWPALALDGNGLPWVAWISCYSDTSLSGSGDRVYAAHWNGASWDTVGISPPSGKYLDPQVIFDGTDMVFAWVELVGMNSDIVVRRYDGTWLPERRLTANPDADFAPALAVDSSGSVWIAWQTFQSSTASHDIHAAFSVGDSFSNHLIVADSPANDREPDIAAAGDGSVWFAWASIRNRHDDVFLRQRQTGSFAPPIAITGTPGMQETYPCLAVDSDNYVWVAYYTVNRPWKYFDHYTIGLFSTGKFQLVRWDGTNISLPYGTGDNNVLQKPLMEDLGYDLPANPIPRYGVRAKLHLDSSNRLWFFSKMNGYIFDAVANHCFWGITGICYSGSTWDTTPPVFISRNGHYTNSPAIAFNSDGLLWIAWTQDRREIEPLRPPPGIYNIMGPDSDVLLDTFVLSSITPQPLQVRNSALPPPFNSGVARVVTRYNISADGTNYGVYWGDNHRHSCDLSSDGIWEYTSENSYSVAFERVGYDWYVGAEHIEPLSPLGWIMIARFSDLLSIPGQFTTFPGYERVGRTRRVGGDGDQTVQFRNTSDFEIPVANVGPDIVWTDLYHFKDGRDVLMIPHHTADASGYVVWEGLIETGVDTLLPPLRLVELFQNTRGSSEFPGCQYEHWKPTVGPDTGWVNLALDDGMRLGFVAGGDHNPGNGFTAVLATEPTQDAIFDALKARRTYATAFSRKMLVDFRVNGALMGEELLSATQPMISFHADCGTNIITSVTIIKNGDQAWYLTTPLQSTVTDSFVDPEPAISGTSAYYYMRIEHSDSGIAWTSPIWVDFIEPVSIAGGETMPQPGGSGGFRFYPSPFKPGTRPLSIVLDGSEAALSHVGIYAINGRLVRRISLRNGRGAWNGRTENDESAGPGVYLFRSIDADHPNPSIGRLVLLR